MPNLQEAHNPKSTITSQNDAAEKVINTLSTEITTAKQNTAAKQNNTTSANPAKKGPTIAQKAITQLSSDIKENDKRPDTKQNTKQDTKQDTTQSTTANANPAKKGRTVGPTDKTWKSLPEYNPPFIIKYSSLMIPIKVSRSTVYKQIIALKTLQEVKTWQEEHWLPYRALSSPVWANRILYGALGVTAVAGGLLGYRGGQRGGGTYNDRKLNSKLIRLVDPLDIHKWFQESSRWIGLELLMRPALAYRCLAYLAAAGVTGGVFGLGAASSLAHPTTPVNHGTGSYDIDQNDNVDINETYDHNEVSNFVNRYSGNSLHGLDTRIHPVFGENTRVPPHTQNSSTTPIYIRHEGRDLKKLQKMASKNRIKNIRSDPNALANNFWKSTAVNYNDVEEALSNLQYTSSPS